MTVVHLLRHGEVHNPDGILYGRLPGYRLSERGQEHARRAAAFLADRDIAVLVSSPLQRALETAQPLADALGLDVRKDERLIEAGNRLEGRRVAGGRALLRSPGIWPLLRNPLKPSWGEPYREIADRMLAAVYDAAAAAQEAGDREAVCVSHQLPIVSVRRLVEGHRLFHDPRRRQCALGSITSLTLEGPVVTDVRYTEPSGAVYGAAPGA